MQRWRKLGYDVFVNVIANLIAAAIIYLLGVYFDLFPGNPGAITVAGAYLVSGAIYVVMAALIAMVRLRRGEQRQRLLDRTAIPVGLLFVVLAVAIVLLAIFAMGEPAPTWARLFGYGVATMCGVGGLFLVVGTLLVRSAPEPRRTVEEFRVPPSHPARDVEAARAANTVGTRADWDELGITYGPDPSLVPPSVIRGRSTEPPEDRDDGSLPATPPARRPDDPA